MKLSASYTDPQGGTMAATFELPEHVSLNPRNLVEYGDALTEIILGPLGGDEGPPDEPKGFHFVNN